MPKVMVLADFGLFLIFAFGIYFGVKATLNFRKLFSKRDRKDNPEK